jgi:hypothetical protein
VAVATSVGIGGGFLRTQADRFVLVLPVHVGWNGYRGSEVRGIEDGAWTLLNPHVNTFSFLFQSDICIVRTRGGWGELQLVTCISLRTFQVCISWGQS